MLKTVKLVWFAAITSLVLFSGCAIKGQPTGIEKEENATQVKEDTTFYNGYLGMELTVPKDWWIYEYDPINMWADAENENDTNTTLQNVMGDDTFSYLPLATYANMRYSSELGHLEATAVAEKVSGIWSLDEYNQQYLDYVMSENADLSPELVLTDTEEINGKTFITNIVRFNGAENPFEIMTMSTEGNHGYYVQFSFTYWADMYDDARVVAKDIVSSYAKFTPAEETEEAESSEEPTESEEPEGTEETPAEE